MDHTPGPVLPAPASGPGALAHFASVCSCGFRIASTMQTNVAPEMRDHVAFMAAKARKAARS